MEIVTVGNRIKRLRTNKNMRQRHLAEELSVSDGTISNWENGRRMPSISELKRIAEYFNVNLNYFDIDDQTNFEQTDSNTAITTNQSVDCRQHGFKISALEQALSFFGFLSLLIAFLLNAPYHFIFLVFGILFQMGVIIGSFIHKINTMSLQKKTLMVQSHATLLYIYKRPQETISISQKWVKNMSLLILIFTIVGYTLLSFAFYSIKEPIWTIVIVVTSFTQILLAYFNYYIILKTKMFDAKINYYKIKKNMSIPPLSIMLYTNVIIAIFLVSFKIIEFSLLSIDRAWIALVIILAMNMMTYDLWCKIKKHIQNYNLYIINQKGNEQKIN